MRSFYRFFRTQPPVKKNHSFFLVLRTFFVEFKPYWFPLVGFLFGVLITCRCQQETVDFIKACFREGFFETADFFRSFLTFFLSELPFLVLFYLLAFCPNGKAFMLGLFLFRAIRMGFMAGFFIAAFDSLGRWFYYSSYLLLEGYWLTLISKRRITCNQLVDSVRNQSTEPQLKRMMAKHRINCLILFGFHLSKSMIYAVWLDIFINTD